jgi:hypothetical protein
MSVSETRRKPSFRTFAVARRGRLPKPLMPYIDPRSWGHVAEWLRNGLQSRFPLELCHRRNRTHTAVSSILSNVTLISCAAFCATPNRAGPAQRAAVAHRLDDSLSIIHRPRRGAQRPPGAPIRAPMGYGPSSAKTRPRGALPHP